MFQVNRPIKKSPPIIRATTAQELLTYRERKRATVDSENITSNTAKNGNS